MTSILVVDDDVDVRQSLCAILDDSGFDTLGFTDAEDLLRALNQIPADTACLLLDVGLPGMSGLDLLSALRSCGFDLPVVMLSGHPELSTAVRAMREGAFDFLAKPVERRTLVDTIEQIRDRVAHRTRRRTDQADCQARLQTLSRREREVMELLVEDKTIKHIGATLGIGIQTAYKHRAKLFRKLNVHSEVELVRLHDGNVARQT
jgi:FixJ family two-component response regulator